MTRRDLLRNPIATACVLLLFCGLAPFAPAAPPPAAAFFQKPAVFSVEINPAGTMLAGIVFDDGGNIIVVTRLSDGARVTAYRDDTLYAVTWAGNDVVVGSRTGLFGRDAKNERKPVIVMIHSQPDGLVVALKDKCPLLSLAEVVDPLPNENDHMLFRMDGGPLYRISISELLAGPKKYCYENARRLLKRSEPLAEIAADYVHWIADHDGSVRAAMTVTHQASSDQPYSVLKLLYRDSADDDWRSIYRLQWEVSLSITGTPMIPIGFAGDNRTLHVLSNQERDTYALFEFDVDNEKLGKLLFERVGADVLDVTMDYSGRHTLAVSYHEEGKLKYHYFDAFGRRYQRSIEHVFPGDSVAIVSSSRASRVLVVFVWGPRNPGAYYLLDTDTNRVELLDRLWPLEPSDLHDVQVLRISSKDDLEIEAFLTRPDATQKPPLVVMPHGGPISVRDGAEFDPVSQYLAANGFAVLQVNYRGSSGYGKSFLQAGQRQWAGGIEDDIDAATDHVIRAGLVDGERICIVGASYGGYSALMSIVRHPRRFRCAATLAGVTDIGLLFTSSDFASDPAGRAAFASIVGDPESEYEQLMTISPAYRASEFRVPVLIAHGWKDRRVDIDHSFQLMAMMDLYGKPYRFIPYDFAEHSLSPWQANHYYQELVRFLKEHLEVSASREGESAAR